ncbi:hypothetical protein PTSG_01061 [Salpingoeca rosetta]|uniref:UDP-galactose transporter n=1 Tax=Salpingoeca rosetta (strain ATCC 50818 / BSB-021) TaxID=946362 RepID=F2TYA2_SALR5|nr:uncharacterized protein PTSG_01061 [Salpingoeca rosetta]EGD76361.1 hypothetical protein PTSG_01061 [Salpingoeca rosetta]|eukprot:XP_004998536.1 hypothetical protein PTSG_01061 [Salpingoeca rosetta]
MASMALVGGVPVAVAITGTHSFLLALTKDDTGRIPFSSASVVLLQETTKLLISIAFSLSSRTWSVSTSDWVYLVPSLCYALNNNAAILLQRHMDSATFQVLCNFKTVTTVLCFYLLLRRTFTPRKWLALLILFLSGTLNTVSGFQLHATEWNPASVFITPIGVVGMLLYCFNSGFASVYSEVIMKRNPEPFFVQSIKLYFGGAVINAVLAAISLHSPADFFTGFSDLTWAIILTQAINGIIYGYVIKHASNILRLFIVAVSMLLATATSAVVLGAHLSFPFLCSAAGVLAAIVLFNTAAGDPKQKPKHSKHNHRNTLSNPNAHHHSPPPSPTKTV